MRQNKLFSVLLACMMSVGAMAQSATSLPYSTGFEDATDNALWQYANATTNQWCIGSAANNGGSNALYISNDGGKSNNYTSNNTVSFAYRAFHFEKGDYVISFDWLCLGESATYGAPYDCMRIILAPASITLQGADASTGTLGALTSFGRNTTTAQIEGKGYIQLNCSNPAKVDYPYCFVDRSTWQSGESCEISISTEGDYYLVLCWYNDSGAHNPAATMDNLLISKKACGNIQDIATSAILSNSVTLTWDKVEEAIGYDYVVLPASSSLDESQAVRTTDTTALVNGLSANTEHVAYIRAICTEGAGSWKKATFRTDCAAQSLPYTEGFEGSMPTGSDVVPYCWNRVAYNNYSTLYPKVYESNYSAHSGEHSLYFSGGSSYSEQIAILPTPAADPNQLMISLYYKNNYTNSSDSKYPQFIVGVMSDPADKTTFVAADTLEQKTSYAQAKVYLNNMPATHKYIAIKYACGSSSTYGYVDDITVDYLPTCVPAQNIHIGATTQTSATIVWEAGKDESSWNVRYSAVGSKDTVSTVVSGTPELTINGLKHSTTYNYQVSVQSDCGGDDKAEASIKTLTFDTECALLTAVRDSILIDFDDYGDKTNFNDIPCWSTFVGTGNAAHTWNVISGQSYKGTMSAHLESLSDNTRSAVLATPQIEVPEGSELSLYAKSSTSNSLAQDDSILVYINANQTLEGATRIGKITGLSTDYQMFRFSISARGNYHVLLESYSYGGVYVDNMLVSPEPACLPPTKLVQGAITSHSVSFSWTPGKNETQWLVSAENKSGSVYLEDEIADGEPTFTISDLESATTDTIEVSVRSVCDDVPSVEALQGTLIFTTTCDPSNHTTAVAGDTLLYTSFEADDLNEPFATGWDANAHICWTNERIGGTGSDNIIWQVANSFYNSHSGTQYLRIVNSSNTRPYILFALPAMIFNAGQEVGLSFYAHGDSSDSIVVYINDKPSLDGATRVGGTGKLQSNYVRYEIEPFATLEGVNYVFLYIEHQISGDTYLDDLTLRMTPTCRKVKEAEIADITTTSATLNWAPAYQENAWHAVVVNGADTIVNTVTTTPSAAINGLQPATKYALHVTIAAICDEVESAEKYDETLTIITDCEVITATTWREGFEGMEAVGSTITATDGPRCWNILDANQENSTAQVYIVGNSTAAHSGNKGMTMVLKEGTVASAYALLPQIEDINGKQIVFWRKTDYRNNPMEVGYMAKDTAGKDVWTSIAKFEYTTTWVEEKVVLECPDTVQNPQFGFRYYNSYSTYYSTCQSYIDDVKVRPVPVCDMATNVRVVDSLATANSATIAWSGHADVGYTVIFCGKDTITKQVDDTMCVLDGLKSSAILKYQVNVVARCAAGEAVDTLSADLQLVTKCGGAITAFPYSVGFEEEDGYQFAYSNPIMPECIASTKLGTGNYRLVPNNTASNVHSGEQCLHLYGTAGSWGSSSNYTYISSFAFPETVIPEENAYELTIWAKVASLATYDWKRDSVEIFYNPKSQAVDSNAVKIGSFKPTATYARYDVTLPAAGSQYVIIKAWATQTSIFFDDMSIRKIPSCFPVENVRVSATGLDTARIAWDTKNDGASYHVVLSRSGSTLYEGVVNDTVLVVRNLASSSTYNIEATITTICADGEESADVYTGSLSFSTKCGTISEFPWVEDFEGYAAGELSNPCWENKVVAGDNKNLFTIVYDKYGTNGNMTHVLQLPDKNVGNYTQLTLPIMDIPEAGAYDFYIDVYRETGNSKPLEGIFILADTDTLGFVPRQIAVEGLNVPTESEKNWYTYHFTIPNAGVQNIIILGRSQWGYATYMDNFMVKENGKVPSALPTSGENQEEVIKFIRHNQVYILRNGVIYNALGQRVGALK